MATHKDESVPEPTPVDIASTLENDGLNEVISEAKSAAARAGVDTGMIRAVADLSNLSEEERNRELNHNGRTSFAFTLKGMKSANSVEHIENELNELDGVDVRIVYPTAMAWVTARRTVDPTVIVEVFAAHGIEASLTDSSLQRRIAWSDVEEGRYNRARRCHHRHRRALSASSRLRKQIEDDQRSIERAKKTGFLDREAVDRRRTSNSTEVLFTARALITSTRLIVSLIFALPVLLISYNPNFQFDYWQWVVALCAIPPVFYGAWPFHRATLGGIRRGMSALDAASSLAITAAFAWSVAMMIFTPLGDPQRRANPQWFIMDPSRFQNGVLFFDVACGMTVILLAGRLLARSTRPKYSDTLDRYRPDPTSTVTVMGRNRKSGEVTREQREVQKLNVGDDILIPPGAIIPVDGRVVGGSSLIDASALGISSRTVKVNSEVYAGCINGDKELKIRVLHTGHRTWLAAIYRWVTDANVHQNHADAIATRTASFLVPWSIFIAASDFSIWALVTGNLTQAFSTALAVLGCTAPVALATSASLAMRQGIESAARRGVLIADGSIIRELDEVDSVIFNRTGTLSEGEMAVETVTAARGENPELVLRVAGALAVESDHPVSRALIRAARESRAASTSDSSQAWIEASHITVDEEGHFHAMVEIPVADAEGEVETRSVEAVLWRPRNLSDLSGRLAAAAVSGSTPLVVSWKGKDRGVITLYDNAKDDATEAVDELEAMGIETMMLSRDTYPVARRYGDTVGVSHVLAGIQPGSKPQAVRNVRVHGTNVAMVGDSSVNECFRVANVGILLGAMESLESASDLDRPMADIVILEDKVAPIPWLFSFGRKITRLVNVNFAFCWAYHIIAIIACCSGIIHPMFATILMLGSSLFIELRSQLARAY